MVAFLPDKKILKLNKVTNVHVLKSLLGWWLIECNKCPAFHTQLFDYNEHIIQRLKFQGEPLSQLSGARILGMLNLFALLSSFAILFVSISYFLL